MQPELQAANALALHDRAIFSWVKAGVLTLLDPKGDRAAPLLAEARGTFERLHAQAMLAAMNP